MKPRTKRSGFTLVEIVVSLMIFSIVAVVALTALVTIINSNAKAQSLESSMTNMDFIMDAMSRELRVGKYYYCASSADGSLPLTNSDTNPLRAQNCPLGQTPNLIAFQSNTTASSDPNCPLVYAYYFAGSGSSYTLEKAEQTACGQSFSPSSYSPILDPAITLTNYSLSVSSQAYPLVSVQLSGYVTAGKQKNQSYFNLETAMSQRIQ
ncbi:MAG: prepilin-type N-terminal cleavage/methylation domain-containing protein [Patescibacteria group bacterium]|nr:prepilin-type N-terminal cleavage/methylation domain-containing protein [Patescibacteria group bacterium]MDE1966618.1 prepilin-type N-terminal cleavage/methylation domain-containing protein [Patescibacteria group bacterium]